MISLNELMYIEIEKITGTNWNYYNHGKDYGQLKTYKPYWNLEVKEDNYENALKWNIIRTMKELHPEKTMNEILDIYYKPLDN